MKRHSLAVRLTAILGVAWLFFFLVLGAVLWQTTLRLIEEAALQRPDGGADAVGGVGHCFLTYPALLFLYQPQGRKNHRLSGRITGKNFFEDLIACG